MFKSFDGLIIVVNMCNLKICALHRILIYCITVILGSNEATSAFQFLNRMVSTTVAEFKLLCIRATSQCEQLMTKADSEDWIFSKQF